MECGMDQNLYIGIKGRVLCLDRATGRTRWEAHLASRYFVNVHKEGANVFAATHGEVFCLDAASGALKWRNKLPGLGRGLITIAGANNWEAIQQQSEYDQAAAASGAAAGAS